MSTVPHLQQFQLDNLNVVALSPLATPKELRDAIPMTPAAAETIAGGRDAVNRIIAGDDDRMLIIVGPCSIHDTDVAIDYARRLKALADELDDRFLFVMRAYFEKPRTTIGWKGLISDPHLDGTNDIGAGLRTARELLITLAEMGLPTATEMLDPIVPQYLSDCVAWASIGARTTESQTHREMASGLSMPVGFKNSTDGNLQVAINALLSAQNQHHFLGIDQNGKTCVVATRGNKSGHVILRGGTNGPNYDPVSVAEAEEQLRKAGLSPRIVVDCSHANSNKRHELQAKVLESVVQQRVGGTRSIIGAMIESNIHGGRQDMPANGGKLAYGVSITDACMDWDSTEAAFRAAHALM